MSEHINYNLMKKIANNICDFQRLLRILSSILPSFVTEHHTLKKEMRNLKK